MELEVFNFKHIEDDPQEWFEGLTKEEKKKVQFMVLLAISKGVSMFVKGDE